MEILTLTVCFILKFLIKIIFFLAKTEKKIYVYGVGEGWWLPDRDFGENPGERR